MVQVTLVMPKNGHTLEQLKDVTYLGGMFTNDRRSDGEIES